MGREENRTEQREEEQEEQAEQQAGKAGSSSRLGKEAKIGVTVILLLLIVFGVVVVVRLTRSNPDGQPLASAGRPHADQDRPGDSADERRAVQGFQVEAPGAAAAGRRSCRRRRPPSCRRRPSTAISTSGRLAQQQDRLATCPTRSAGHRRLERAAADLA